MRRIRFILMALTGLPLIASAGQVVNGDFHDSATFGDDVGWTSNYNPPATPVDIDYVSPGQGGSTSAIELHANNDQPLTYIYQDVAISSGSFVPMLDFYYSAASADGTLAKDGQLVQIKNTSDVVQATPLQISHNDSFGWVHVSYPLSSYVGQTVRLYFAAYGTFGYSAGSDLYLDTISINYATYTPTVTVTRTATRTATRTPSFTYSPTLTRTPTPTATVTYQPPTQVQNGDFNQQTGVNFDFWTKSPSNSDVTATFPGHNGADDAVNMLAFSSIPISALYQVVHVNSGTPLLSFWYYPIGAGDHDATPLTGDSQFFLIRNPSDNAVEATVLAVAQDTGSAPGWHEVTYDLSSFIGQNIQLYFGTSAGGSGGALNANFSDVEITYGTATASPTGTPSSTVSPTPTLTRTPTVTPTATPTASPTASPSVTLSSTKTLTFSPSPTRTVTPTRTPSDTRTISPSPTGTKTPSPTKTPTFTATPSRTATLTRTASPSPSLTATRTLSRTSTPSATVSATRSVSPTKTSSPALTATPDFAASTLGRTVAAPVPARGSQPVCLYFDKAPASSSWKVYDLVGELVARLDFGAESSQCWAHKNMAAGLYFLVWKVNYAAGGSASGTQKLVLVP